MIEMVLPLALAGDWPSLEGDNFRLSLFDELLLPLKCPFLVWDLLKSMLDSQIFSVED